MFMLNLLILVIIFCLGMYAAAWGIARIIMESSEADILAKIREIKKEAGM
jgi:hypothetical protein